MAVHFSRRIGGTLLLLPATNKIVWENDMRNNLNVSKWYLLW